MLFLLIIPLYWKKIKNRIPKNEQPFTKRRFSGYNKANWSMKKKEVCL